MPPTLVFFAKVRSKLNCPGPSITPTPLLPQPVPLVRVPSGALASGIVDNAERLKYPVPPLAPKTRKSAPAAAFDANCKKSVLIKSMTYKSRTRAKQAFKRRNQP